MILPCDKYGLLLLADWLEEHGSSYDIVKSTAIRNNKYNLNFEDNCRFAIENEFEYGCGFGDGEGFGFGEAKGFVGDNVI